MAEFCPTCAHQMGFEPETIDKGEICEGCGAKGQVRNSYPSPYLIAIVVIFILSTLIAASCRPARPTSVHLVTKVQHNRVQLDHDPKWYYLPLDSTADVGDTIAISHNKKSTLPKIHRKPFR